MIPFMLSSLPSLYQLYTQPTYRGQQGCCVLDAAALHQSFLGLKNSIHIAHTMRTAYAMQSYEVPTNYFVQERGQYRKGLDC